MEQQSYVTCIGDPIASTCWSTDPENGLGAPKIQINIYFMYAFMQHLHREPIADVLSKSEKNERKENGNKPFWCSLLLGLFGTSDHLASIAVPPRRTGFY